MLGVVFLRYISWLMVLLKLFTGEVDCSCWRKAMKKYVAVCFHAGAINNCWPYMVSGGAPYKKHSVKEWGWLDPKGSSFSWAPFVVGSGGDKKNSHGGGTQKYT